MIRRYQLIKKYGQIISRSKDILQSSPKRLDNEIKTISKTRKRLKNSLKETKKDSLKKNSK